MEGYDATAYCSWTKNGSCPGHGWWVYINAKRIDEHTSRGSIRIWTFYDAELPQYRKLQIEHSCETERIKRRKVPLARPDVKNNAGMFGLTRVAHTFDKKDESCSQRRAKRGRYNLRQLKHCWCRVGVGMYALFDSVDLLEDTGMSQLVMYSSRETRYVRTRQLFYKYKTATGRKQN